MIDFFCLDFQVSESNNVHSTLLTSVFKQGKKKIFQTSMLITVVCFSVIIIYDDLL